MEECEVELKLSIYLLSASSRNHLSSHIRYWIQQIRGYTRYYAVFLLTKDVVIKLIILAAIPIYLHLFETYYIHNKTTVSSILYFRGTVQLLYYQNSLAN